MSKENLALDSSVVLSKLHKKNILFFNQTQDFTIITYRWRNDVYKSNQWFTFLVIFTVLLEVSFSVCLFIAGLIFRGSKEFPTPPLFFMGLFLLFFAYSMLAYHFNSTEILLTKQTLKLRHFPCWWLGKTEIKFADINGFIVDERGRKGRTYVIIAVKKNHRIIYFAPGFYKKKLATIIRQHIERVNSSS
jgi:hypothetical protein